jgi:Tfp pilus assembly protein PilZ
MPGMSFAFICLQAPDDNTTGCAPQKGRTTMATGTSIGGGTTGFGEPDLSAPRPRPGPTVAERRAVLRYAVELPVTVNSEHNFYEALLRDMGVAGVFVATHRANAIGEWIELNIRLPDGGAPVRVIGEVRWTRKYRGEGAPEPGIGVQFRTISPQDGARIAMFLSRCVPIVNED